MPAARFRAIAVVAVLLVALSGCSGARGTVVADSEIRIGFSGEVTSLNPASVRGASPANQSIAAMTRGGFEFVDASGVSVDDASFGTAEIVDEDPFTVRYDLADGITWSDGVPIDSADLLLAWAAGSNAVSTDGFDVAAARDADGALELGEDAWFDVADPGALARSTELPERDAFARSIDVVFDAPRPDWATALDVAVPAHVLGRLAVGIDDPMEAKHAVIQVLERGTIADVALLADAWNTGFDVRRTPDDPGVLVSSGPYRVDSIAAEGITLIANEATGGDHTPTIERVRLMPMLTDADALARLTQGELDVVRIQPLDDLRIRVRDLVRDGAMMQVAGDGTVYALTLRTGGVFANIDARRSFLHAVPRQDLQAAGLGAWSDEAVATDATLFQPNTEEYGYALEDAGFSEAFGGVNAETALAEQALAGLSPGTPVCVLYDRADPFATRALPVLQAAAAEAGWAVQDCGTNDLAAGLAAGAFDAVLMAARPATQPALVPGMWRSGAPGNLTGAIDPQRDALIDQLEVEADASAASDLMIQIEASIIDDALTLPIVQRPVVTVSRAGFSGIKPRGGLAPVTWNAWEWGLERDE